MGGMWSWGASQRRCLIRGFKQQAGDREGHSVGGNAWAKAGAHDLATAVGPPEAGNHVVGEGCQLRPLHRAW